MQTPDCKYFELVTGGLHNRGRIVEKYNPIELEDLAGNYETLWRYDKGLVDHVQKHGTVAGYDGIHTAKYIIFDFDDEENLENAQRDALALIKTLVHVYEVDMSSIVIFFSGNKGFHIYLPIELLGNITPSNDFADRYKKFIDHVAGKFKTSDLSIYNRLRLMRIPNTKHEKSGLYKRHISESILRDFKPQDYKKACNIPEPEFDNPLENTSFTDVLVNPALEEIWHDIGVEEENKTEQDKQVSNTFIEALNTGASSGNRHGQITKIVGFLIDRGIGINEAIAMVKLWNKQNNPPLSDERITKDVKGMYDSYWDKRPKMIEKPSLKDIMVYGSGYTSAYEKHLNRIGKFGRIKTGYDIIDQPMRGGIAGEVGLIVGKTSIGKSALLQNILLNNASEGRIVLFFSLEMPIANVAERNLQMKLLKSGREIERRCLEGDMYLMDDIKKTNETLNRFVTIPVQGIKYNLIEEYIKEAEQIFGEKIEIVGIDYAGLIETDGKTLYEQQSAIAKDLKALSGRTETFIWNLVQVSKAYKENDPLDLDSTRDSGVPMEASDYAIGIWRAKRIYEQYVAVDGALMKNRNGSRQEFSARLHKQSLIYTLGDRVTDEQYHNKEEDLF